MMWRGMCQRHAVCFEKDAANVNRPANGVTKPTPVIYEPATLIEAGNRVDKRLELDFGTLRMTLELPDGA